MSLVFRSSSKYDGRFIDGQQQALNDEIWRKRTEEIYADSGLFRAVLGEDEPGDVRAEVRVIAEFEVLGSLMLSLLTLWIVPTVASETYALETDFRSPQGDVLASIVKSDSVTTWVEPLLLFIMPFHSPPSTGRQVLADLNRATLAEAHAKGVF